MALKPCLEPHYVTAIPGPMGARLRPKKILFRVTCQKNIGRVGTIFFFLFIFFYIEKCQIIL